MEAAFSINKYLPISILYIFLNGFLLPQGLLYTTILTPILLLWLSRFPSFKYLIYFFLAIVPFVLVHLINGVVINFYVKSFLLLFSVYVFCLSFFQFLQQCNSLRTLYKNIVFINLLFLILALAALAIPSLTSTFWYSNQITSGFKQIKRLKMLTYEPSYYSTLLAPIALYYYMKITILKLPNPFLIVSLITIPLLLSLSFGVIFGIGISLFFTTLYAMRIIYPGKSIFLYIVISGIVLLILVITFLTLFPDNVFVVRLTNVFSQKDTSFTGRTSDSFYLAWEIASQKNIIFGTGLGQVKEIGLDVFKKFYNYPHFKINEIGIPNAIGDTLATFGILGVLLRLGTEIYLFYKTKVYNNFYRLSLFLFIFIYQFTGSFIMNIAEYVIWILAFYGPLFPEFNKTFFSKPEAILPGSKINSPI